MRAPVMVLILLEALSPAVLAQGMASSGEILGAVLSQDNVLLEGVEVVLEGVGYSSTDCQGHFTFTGVAPGDYRLTASKPGFPATTRAMSVRAGVTERVELTLADFAEPPRAQGQRVAVPLLRAGNAFLVRARVNWRRETLFYADTGATITTVSRGLAQELGLAVGPGAPTMTLLTASGRVEVPVGSVDATRGGRRGGAKRAGSHPPSAQRLTGGRAPRQQLPLAVSGAVGSRAKGLDPELVSLFTHLTVTLSHSYVISKVQGDMA